MGHPRATLVSSPEELLGEPDDELSWSSRHHREPMGWGSALFVLLGLAALAAGLYAVAYLLADDRVPRGASVAGVAIGGMSPSAATATLARELEPRADSPITVYVGSHAEQVTATQAGLRVDLPATVSRAGAGASWSPGRLWDYWTGGHAVEPVVAVDQPTLDATVRTLVRRTATAPVDGGVSFDRDGGIRTREPRTGRTVADATAIRALSAAYLSTDREVTLPLTIVQPAIGPDDVQAALDDFANVAVSGPVTLRFGRTPVRLAPRDFTAALSMVPRDGRLVAQVDESVLAGLVAGHTGGSATPVDASVRLVDGRPQVVPAQPGETWSAHQIATAFRAVVDQPDGRRATTVVGTRTPATFTTRDARHLGIDEQVSTATVAPSTDLGTDLAADAARVDGTVLRPGQTLSLDTVLGPTGTSSADLDPLATAVYDAAYQAGLGVAERHARPSYDAAYPPGRDATLTTGDLRFTDDTSYGVLVHVTATATGVTVSLWSTHVWDVTVSAAPRTGVTPPATRTDTTASCAPRTGTSGFAIELTRTFRRSGASAVDHQDTSSTTYSPTDTVVCSTPTP